MLKLIHCVHHYHHQVYNWWEEVRKCWASPAAQSLAATCEQRRQTLLSPSLLFSAASIFTSQSSASNTNTNKQKNTKTQKRCSLQVSTSIITSLSPTLSSTPHSNLNLCLTSYSKWKPLASDCCFLEGEMLLGCLSETDRMIINGGWQRAAIIVSACSCTSLSCACTMGTKCMLPTQRHLCPRKKCYLQVQTESYEHITSWCGAAIVQSICYISCLAS